MTANRVLCTAPVRIDLSHGGGSDLPDICRAVGGRAVNVAARVGDNLVRTEVTRIADPVIRLESAEIGETETLRGGDVLFGSAHLGSLSLHRATIAMSGIVKFKARADQFLERVGGGVLVRTETFLPVGSGLGVSAILAATLLWCVRRLAGLSVDLEEIVTRVLRVEHELGTRGGWQDVVGGSYGGAKTIVADVNDPFSPHVLPIEIDSAVQRTLEERMLLCYTGETHFSGDVIGKLIRDFETRREPQWSAREELGRLDGPIALSLERGDIDGLGELLERFWKGFLILVPEAETTPMRRIVAATRDDLSGYKACGAGGGGCMILVTREGRSAKVREALGNLFNEPGMTGARTLDWVMDRVGLSGRDLASDAVKPEVEER